MAGSDAFNLFSIVLVDNLSVSFNVLGGFFQSVTLSLEGVQDVSLGEGLSSGEFFTGDAVGEVLEFSDGGVKDFSSVRSSTSNGKTEETSIGEVEVNGTSSINPVVFIKKVLVDSAGSASTSGGGRSASNDGVKDLEGEDILASPRSRSEGKTDSDVVVFSDNSVFTTEVVGGFSSVGVTGDGGDEGELRFNEFNEFLVVFNTSGNNEDSVGVDVFKLELLEDVSGKVLIVVVRASKGVTKTVSTESSSQKGIVEGLTSSEVSFEFVFVGNLGLSGVGSNDGSGFKGTISNHVEDVDDVVL